MLYCASTGVHVASCTGNLMQPPKGGYPPTANFVLPTTTTYTKAFKLLHTHSWKDTSTSGKSKNTQLRIQQLILQKTAFFEKNLQWTIRFESINKKNIILYVQSKRPLILWKKDIALNELGKCADENFSLAIKDQSGAPQLVLTALKKTLFCYLRHFIYRANILQ